MPRSEKNGSLFGRRFTKDSVYAHSCSYAVLVVRNVLFSWYRRAVELCAPWRDVGVCFAGVLCVAVLAKERRKEMERMRSVKIRPTAANRGD